MEKDEDEFTLAMISGQGCVGTADYIAPEQTIDSFAVGPQADIYSLGCTLYCALTGTVPFPGESVSKKLRAHRTKTARPVREIKPEVPAAVEEIVTQDDGPQDLGTLMRPRPKSPTALQPHARRDSASFDFTQILAQRSAEARQRVNMLRQLGRARHDRTTLERRASLRCDAQPALTSSTKHPTDQLSLHQLPRLTSIRGFNPAIGLPR